MLKKACALGELGVVVAIFLAWLIFTGQLNLPVMLVGIAVTLVSVLIIPFDLLRILSVRIFGRMIHIAVFLLYMLLEVFQASYRLAFFALHPRLRLRAAIRAYDYRLESRIAILFLSTLITLTPGTLVLEISPMQKRLYIHTLEHIPEDREPESSWETIELMESWLRRIFE